MTFNGDGSDFMILSLLTNGNVGIECFLFNVNYDYPSSA